MRKGALLIPRNSKCDLKLQIKAVSRYQSGKMNLTDAYPWPNNEILHTQHIVASWYLKWGGLFKGRRHSCFAPFYSARLSTPGSHSSDHTQAHAPAPPLEE